MQRKQPSAYCRGQGLAEFFFHILKSSHGGPYLQTWESLSWETCMGQNVCHDDGCKVGGGCTDHCEGVVGSVVGRVVAS